METYDIITVGSGHNVLVVAALLARAGNRVLVLRPNNAGKVAFSKRGS